MKPDCSIEGVAREALKEADALLLRPGTRNHKSMRKFVLKHTSYQDELTWFHNVFCNDGGFSSAQLQIIGISAHILTWAAAEEARESGLNVNARDVDLEASPVANRIILESVWTPLSPETCTIQEARKLVELIAALLQKKLALLDNCSTFFVDCPDYEVRGLSMPKEAKPWAVIAKDKRTGQTIWEYCTDHADAKARRALMRAHSYRFSNFEIMSPRALEDHENELRQIFAPANEAADNKWSFPQAAQID